MVVKIVLQSTPKVIYLRLRLHERKKRERREKNVYVYVQNRQKGSCKMRLRAKEETWDKEAGRGYSCVKCGVREKEGRLEGKHRLASIDEAVLGSRAAVVFPGGEVGVCCGFARVES
jgi:hypothetical protein